jgi:hypothetical protein
MRVALCLSGQPRKAIETYKNIYEYIIKPNNADVFIHMNYENGYFEKTHIDNGTCIFPDGLDKEVVDLYKPISYQIEKPHDFKKPSFQVPENRIKNIQKMNHHKNWTDDQCKQHFIKQMTSMYYSIYKCNELKEVYSNEQGIKYDYVIRSRFDFCPFSPLICSQLDPSYLHYVELAQPDHIISDWFNVGSNSIMNVYASMYLQMDYLNTFTYFKKEDRHENTLEPSEVCGGMAEHMLRDLMHLYRIPKRGMIWNMTLL